MTTVTAVKRALDEASQHKEVAGCSLGDAFELIAENPTALTILANRLSDRGRAGNAAVEANLAVLRELISSRLSQAEGDALEWAIDQLTPPELAKPVSLEPPPPPWEAGAKTNAMREGWQSYWSGRAREACPFPPSRNDLLKQYQTGWDCAKQADPKAAQPSDGLCPKCGDLEHGGPFCPNRV